MTLLQDKLDLLFQMMAGGAEQSPRPGDALIVERSRRDVDDSGRLMIAAADLQTVEQYNPRFSALMAKGFAWINLSFFGVLDGRALVTVEFPNYEPIGTRGPTSVNFSGPMRAVSTTSWDARPRIVFK